jgi:hypothetical protein
VNPEEDAVLMEMAPLQVSALCGQPGASVSGNG